jgi:hypothetical protein
MIDPTRILEAHKVGLMRPGEMWFGHHEYPGYLIEVGGAVISFNRRKPFKMRAGMTGKYPSYGLKTAGGAIRTTYLHRLVAELVHGPCPVGMECRHKDGDSTNADYQNLAWGTPQENAADKVRHGTSSAGQNNGCAKLTWEIVEAMRQERSDTGLSHKKIAKKYGISTMAAYRAIEHKSWRR